MAADAILIVATGWNQEEWADAVRAAAPERRIFLWPNVPDKAAVAYALAWKPPEGLLASLPNLKVIFSLGAGVDHIVLQKDLPDVPIVRVVSADLTARMTAWVVLQVLIHHRRQPEYDALKLQHRWRELRQPATGDCRVGIMGMGVIGRDTADVLVRLGFDVAGWRRSSADVPGMRLFLGFDQLDAFLARTDVLVSLLPLTPETRGILAMPLFRKLARDGALDGPILINAGRGGLQVDDDIAAALDGGILRGASLDVFETEPLPATSRLWDEPRLIITPHCAGWSAPEAIAPGMIEQLRAFENGTPLADVVDREALY
jgi:glyoxylate/hydroxypyruvate reductase A